MRFFGLLRFVFVVFCVFSGVRFCVSCFLIVFMFSFSSFLIFDLGVNLLVGFEHVLGLGLGLHPHFDGGSWFLIVLVILVYLYWTCWMRSGGIALSYERHRHAMARRDTILHATTWFGLTHRSDTCLSTSSVVNKKTNIHSNSRHVQ